MANASKSLTRNDFLVKDVAISIGAGRGGTWMPGPDDETPPSPISPIASVLVNMGYIEAVRGTVVEAAKENKWSDIAAAFVPGQTGGNAVIRNAIHEIGAAVVASAAYGALGKIGLPNPDCGGTSLETIPPTKTPIVHVGLAVHRVSELPRLKRQLEQTLDYVNNAVNAQTPHGAELGALRDKVQGALK